VRSEYQKKWVEKCKRNRVCASHSNQSAVNAKCEKCITDQRLYNKKLYHDRKLKRICPKHPTETLDPGKSICKRCVAYGRSYGKQIREQAIELVFKAHGIFECQRYLHQNIPHDLKSRSCWGNLTFEHPKGGGHKLLHGTQLIRALLTGKENPKDYYILCRLHQIWNQDKYFRTPELLIPTKSDIPRVFIGYDSRMPVVSDVLAYTIRKYASRPVDIIFLKLNELSLQRFHDPLQSTEFTYTRFLVPYLCDFSGTALFLDNDMICFDDIWKILDLPIDDYMLRVVKHNYTPTSEVKMDGKIQSVYPRKNWSSMMLMNCEKLQCWSKDNVEKQSGAWLHRFEPIPDDQIGELPEGWNILDKEPDLSKVNLWHMTEGGPWFDKYQNILHSGVWYKAFYDMLHNR
jgi:hypothetical protein